jgi:hypothetical protein
MRHIRQKITDPYTVVNVNDGEVLEDHPSILEHPEVFEISEDPIPENAQFLNYTS